MAEPELLDVAVGHAGDVVGDGAGEAFGWESAPGGRRAAGRDRPSGLRRIPERRGLRARVLLPFPASCRSWYRESSWRRRVRLPSAGLRAAILAGARRMSSRWWRRRSTRGPDFFDQIGDKGVEHAVEGFIDRLLGLRGGVLRHDLVVESAEERDMAARHLRRSRMPESRPSSKSAVR